jgi:hypothetical protein
MRARLVIEGDWSADTLRDLEALAATEGGEAVGIDLYDGMGVVSGTLVKVETVES